MRLLNILMFVVLSSCLLENCTNDKLPKEINTHQTSREQDCANILSESLYNYLKLFRNEVNNIPNEYNLPVIYHILFENKNDSTVKILADIFPHKINPNFSELYEIKGGVFCDNHLVVIYDYRESVGELFYKLDLLVSDYKTDSFGGGTEGISRKFVNPYLSLKINENLILTIKEDNMGNGVYNAKKL